MNRDIGRSIVFEIDERPVRYLLAIDGSVYSSIGSSPPVLSNDARQPRP